MKKAPPIYHGQKETKLGKDEFFKRYQRQFFDPNFDPLRAQIEELTEVAWSNYQEGRKSPKTHPAGKGFADPTYELSDEWRAVSLKLKKAAKIQKSPSGKPRILLISGSSRSEHTCPGETPKSVRLTDSVTRHLKQKGAEVDFLDLSRLTAEFGIQIHPCKACVSTAMPLCHWPCSCYPNHSLGQEQDYMNEIYERFTLAHGIMIVSPVHWYQVPSVLKLMIDRLVCADGGNPDPTSTDGKNPTKAKNLELKGWDYPKHLSGRAYSVVIHGDAVGSNGVRDSLTNWLNDMKLVPAPPSSQVDGFIGFMKPYATSHVDYDKEKDFRQRTLAAADGLLFTTKLLRKGEWPTEDFERRVKDPNPK